MRCVNTTESAGLNPLLITVNEANSVLLYIWTVDYLQAVLEELLSRFFIYTFLHNRLQCQVLVWISTRITRYGLGVKQREG